MLWLPNLVVGLVVLVLGGLAANGVSGLVRGASAPAELGNADTLATIAKAAVWGFAIVIAVNQIGIAQTLINTLFMAEAAARLHAIEIAVNLDLQHCCWAVTGTARRQRLNIAEAELAEFKAIDKYIDCPYGVVLGHKFVKPRRK